MILKGVVRCFFSNFMKISNVIKATYGNYQKRPETWSIAIKTHWISLIPWINSTEQHRFDNKNITNREQATDDKCSDICFHRWSVDFNVVLLLFTRRYSGALIHVSSKCWKRLSICSSLWWATDILALVLLIPDMPCLWKQCRSRSVGFWFISALFDIQYENQQPGSIWLADNEKWVWHFNLFRMVSVREPLRGPNRYTCICGWSNVRI